MGTQKGKVAGTKSQSYLVLGHRSRISFQPLHLEYAPHIYPVDMSPIHMAQVLLHSWRQL